LNQKHLVAPAIAILSLLAAARAHAAGFTIEQVLSAPFSSGIVVAPAGREFAWVSDAAGRRNVWLAAADSGTTGFTSRPLTHYIADDGLDISDLAFVPHHEQLLYVHGGDVEYPDKPAPNPAQLTAGVEQEIYLVGLGGGMPVKLGAGSYYMQPATVHRTQCASGADCTMYIYEDGRFSFTPTTEDGKSLPPPKAK